MPTSRPLFASILLCAACGSNDAPPSLLGDTSIVYPGTDWETAEPAALGFSQAGLDHVAALADADNSHCLLVTRKGRIVAEHYWDGWTADSQQVVHSVTKSFTSTLVGIAQDRGLLQVDEPATKYIPEWEGTDSAAVTLAHLLSNSSGRHWDFVGDYLTMAGSSADKTAYAISLGQDHPPGTFWEYNNSAIQTLDRVLKRATGESDVAAFAKAHLFDPLGMKASMDHDSAGNTLMFGGLKASCRDLARFGYLFLRGGVWADQKRIVSAEWVAQATRVSTPLNAAYGYLWWLNNDGHYVQPSAPARIEGDGKQMPRLPESTFAALGLAGQIVAVDPEHEIVMTRIGGDGNPALAITSGGDLTGASVVTELGNALGDALTK